MTLPEYFPLEAAHFSDKAALRRALRARRARVSPLQRRHSARRLVRLALGLRLLSRRRRIGFYVATKNEIDVGLMLAQARAMGADCYLPVVPARGLRKLWFVRLGNRDVWMKNRYGIPEYRHPPARRVRAYQLDLLFLPLLGFDEWGSRIGMGGGYYDASLARLGQRCCWRQPRLIGVAFANQQVDRIPRDPWDVPLAGVLTERGYLSARRGQ
ncbi:MAG: 5-formyltetrahydrofolate cyclo-ligase [Pseudomonadota bacterium]